jgi:uncharacterized membrane protein YhaH (DUF805 family)
VSYYLMGYRRYIDFRGRSTRTEYWMFVLFHVIVAGILITLAGAVSDRLIFLFSIYYLGTIVPLIALATRRLHDVGLTGWLQLLAIIPLGGLAVIVMVCLPGVHGPNKHGPDPRESIARPVAPDPWAVDPEEG